MTDPLTGYRRPSSLRYYREGPPEVDLAQWRLKVGGLGVDEVVFDYEMISRLPHVVQDRRMVCVCNWSVRHQWRGVLLASLLDEIGWDKTRSGQFLVQTSIGTPVRGTYSSTLRIGAALERDALIVDTIDSAPLRLDRGFPVRLMDFALYGYKGVKGLASLEVTDLFELGFWEKHYGYEKEGVIRPKRYRACDLGHMILAEQSGEITEE